MARLTDKQRECILADFHVGKSQNELAKIYEVSPATINKICKGIQPKHAENVNTLTRIKTELVGESECQVNAIHKEVDERTRHIQFFNNATVKNLSIMADKIDESTSIMDHRIAQSAIKDGRETVLGKSPDVAVQINNNQDQPRTLDRFYGRTDA